LSEKKRIGDLILTKESAAGEAISKAEAHVPKIEAPDSVKANQPFTIHVSVGPHPNMVEHSIRRIEVYFYEQGRPFNPILLSVHEFTPVYSEPDVKVNLKLAKGGGFHVLEYCNVHGLWEAHKAIKVIA